MCLIALSINQHPTYQLVFAANRDEFYDRPAKPMHEWDTDPSIIAGRDLKAGGTWLGVSRDGRFAAVTNVREPGRYREHAESRGAIPTAFLLGDQSADEFVRSLKEDGEAFNGFNVLAGSPERIWYASNRVEGEPVQMDRGMYTLSNAALSSQWHKTELARRHLDDTLIQKEIQPEDLFDLLHDPTLAPPEDLPDTGLSPKRERAASSIFIRTPKYGTRCSTILMASRDGRMLVMERTYDNRGDATQTQRFEFQLSR